MSLNSSEILIDYLKRRGYFNTFDSKNEKVDFEKLLFASKSEQTSMIFMQNMKKCVESYVNFVKSLSKNDQEQLSLLNKSIFVYLKSINNENNVVQNIPENYLNEIFDLYNSAKCLNFNKIDENLRFKVTEFVKTLENDQFKEIFNQFLSENDSEFDIKIEKSGHVTTGNDDSASSKSKYNQEILFYRLKNLHNQVLCADFNKNNGQVAAGLENGFLNVFSSSKKQPKTLYGHSSSIYSLKYLSRYPQYLLSGSEDCSIKIWDLQQEQCLYTYKGHFRPIFCLDIDYRNRFFLSGSTDNTARLFDFERNIPVRVLANHSDAVQQVMFADGLISGLETVLVTAGADKKVCLWSPEQACPVRVYHHLKHCPTSISYHPAANLLLIGSFDRRLTLIDVRADKDHLEICDLQDFIPYSMDFSYENDKKLIENDEKSIEKLENNGQLRQFLYVAGSTTYGYGSKIKKIDFSAPYRLDDQCLKNAVDYETTGVCHVICANPNFHTRPLAVVVD